MQKKEGAISRKELTFFELVPYFPMPVLPGAGS